MAKSLIKDIKQQVAEGDVEELKKLLRVKRKECLDTFSKAGCSFVWNKCFREDTEKFDGGLFLKKLEAISDDGIDPKDLEDVLTYVCMTENIDRLLREVFTLENKNAKAVNQIIVQNLAFNNGTINVHSEKENNAETDEEDEEILRNLIFVEKLFDSNAKLLKLRDEIAKSIDMGDYNNVFGDLDRHRINPAIHSEWYYILKAIEESGVATKRFSVANFVEQVIIWYPWLFEFETLEAKLLFVRKMEKSISHEKGLWKYGPTRSVTLIKDIWSRWRSLNMDFSKVARVQPIAKSLLDGLTNLKSEMEKENSKKYM